MNSKLKVQGMQVIQKVERYIDHHKLLSANTTILVGVSGGADSMVLLDILCRLGYTCIAAHCNFHLRGEESDRDCDFVQKECKAKGIQFVSVHFDTYAYMKQNSVSLEVAARELRYTWFEEMRLKQNADYIAIAHHLNDSAETFLINLIRGTGIRGLSGIPPVNGFVIRPLLCLYQDDIAAYIDTYHIDYVVDSTNKQDVFVRNKVRLDILPLLQTINPSVVRAIADASDHLLAVQEVYIDAIEKSKQRVFDANQNKISIQQLLLEKQPKQLLFEILYPYGFNSDTVDRIFESIHGLSGKVFYSKTHQLLKDRASFMLRESITKDDTVYQIDVDSKKITEPLVLTFESFSNTSDFVIVRSNQLVYLDKAKLTYPLSIRRWSVGDKFVPFGMKGSKKLSDYFSDRKFSLLDKDKVWLLFSGNKIVWIIGERADDRFRITDKTTEVLSVKLSIT
ncbi:MAG: tRNA lysidine(34) synthetase TilS [Bacteroidota bacterium]|jgi:tRNA(Ile)-lysidine synthase